MEAQIDTCLTIKIKDYEPNTTFKFKESCLMFPNFKGNQVYSVNIHNDSNLLTITGTQE